MDARIKGESRLTAADIDNSSRHPTDGGVATSRRLTDFYSILFETPDDGPLAEPIVQPAFFADLNCDQLVAEIVAGREDYNLVALFHQCLSRAGAIKYRHEVIQDLENPLIRDQVNHFSQIMRDVRERLARTRKLHYKEQKEAWFLDAVSCYCQGVISFANSLAALDLRSPGLLGFHQHLLRYCNSPSFESLAAEADSLRHELARIKYAVQIRGSSFTVRDYEQEADYSREVEATFEKFKQGAARDYRAKFHEREEMNHIEAKILEFVSKLNSDVFADVTAFCASQTYFIADFIASFDREIQFYIAYLEYISPLRAAGLKFCYPLVSDQIYEIHDRDGFDIVLSRKLIENGSPVVRNDFHLKGLERILVVSGPNQGGKTTFARTFGQLHYLASIGCPVPGRDAQLFLFDGIFTHFEKEEKVENLRGKLEDDLVRVHAILSHATARSIIVLNEVFTSTTIHDETFLSKKIMEKVIALGCLCVWVTFVEDLAAFGLSTVSMVSTVVPENPALRTFKVVRRPADGLAYAMAIAQKYRLTYESILERIPS